MRTVTTAALLGLLLISNASAQTATSPPPEPKVSAGGVAPEPGSPLKPQSNAGRERKPLTAQPGWSLRPMQHRGSRD